MAAAKTRTFGSLLCTVLLIGAILLSGTTHHQQRAWAWQYCEDDDIYGIYGHCSDSIQRKGPLVPPSPLCCSFVSNAEMVACVCQHLVTRKVEKSISIPRLLLAAGCCGVALDPGTKCGNYTVPPGNSTAPACQGR